MAHISLAKSKVKNKHKHKRSKTKQKARRNQGWAQLLASHCSRLLPEYQASARFRSPLFPRHNSLPATHFQPPLLSPSCTHYSTFRSRLASLPGPWKEPPLTTEEEEEDGDDDVADEGPCVTFFSPRAECQIIIITSTMSPTTSPSPPRPTSSSRMARRRR